MIDNERVVVKVGGSLYDWPELRGRLNAWLKNVDAHNVVLVPGGGGAADVVRAFDLTHRLGEEESHWLAIQALSLNARFLHTLVPGAKLLTDPIFHSSELPCGRLLRVLDPLPFFRDDESRPDPLPHAWDVTSDSLAVRAAKILDASELVLLKSVDWCVQGDWAEAAQRGIVDGYFLTAIQQLTKTRIRIVNLRA